MELIEEIAMNKLLFWLTAALCVTLPFADLAMAGISFNGID
jgi:hypothetical protein